MGHYSASKATKHSILPQIKMKTLLLVAACLGAALTAPQYGNSGGGSAHQPQRRPNSGSSIRCRTEQTTIWDTEYVETQENVCNTEYVEQCQTLYQQKCRPTTREVCQTVNEQQCTTDYKEECHDESGLSTKPTQKRSATPATRRTASTTGRELDTISNGCRIDRPVRTTHTTTARMYKSSKKDKCPTRYVTRSQSRIASTSPGGSASRSLTKNAPMSPTRSVTRCPRRNAMLNTRRRHTGSVALCQRRSAMGAAVAGESGSGLGMMKTTRWNWSRRKENPRVMMQKCSSYKVYYDSETKMHFKLL